MVQLSRWPTNVPADFETAGPSAVWIRDYRPGGGRHFAIDRKFADRAARPVPEIADIAGASRVFLRREVRDPARREIRRFTDIARGGSGDGTGHEIAPYFVPDSDRPREIIGAYYDPVPPGGYLTLSRKTGDARPKGMRGLVELYRASANPGTLRGHQEIEEFFVGFGLEKPGLAPVPKWRPEKPELVGDNPHALGIHAGVGRRA